MYIFDPVKINQPVNFQIFGPKRLEMRIFEAIFHSKYWADFHDLDGCKLEIT